ncbi:hypothetical protein BDD12DRAFT_982209 [Trichophaea hybrida]|nr:hypothetical protein BDD12DRAFT_982209 [Trichophaea hybrida]
MSSSGQRRRRDKQRNQRGRTQPYPLRNEQRHVQGDGASRVNPLRERDGIFPPEPTPSTKDYSIQLGASHNTSGGRIIDHTARSLNTVARHNTVSSGNTTITNSNNVEDNARTFNDSNFNEFDRSTFNGPVNFAENIYHSPQPGPPIPAPTHRDMEKLVQTIDWATLSRQLSVVDQDENRFKISPFDRNEPENFWISKNIDFTQWESANDSRALFLSAPPGHGTTEVCSHIIDLVKEKAALQTNSSVMYFFSSTATEARCSTVFTHTLLHQIVCCSSIEKADSIAATFLDTLLSRHLQRHTQVFTEDDQVNTTIQKILNAPKYELVEALVEAIKTGGIEELYIIVDGLSEDIARLVVKHGMRAIRKLKTLFTINESPRYRDMLDRITYIEYDKERKGLNIRHSVA